MEVNEIMKKFFLLKRIMGNIMRKMEMGSELSISEVSILLKISEEPGLSLSRLSELTGFSNSLITFAIDALEEKGLVMRIKGRDRRIFYVELTDQGREKCASIRKEMSERFMKVFSKVQGEDLSILDQTLDKMIKIMQKIESDSEDKLQGEKSGYN